MLYVNLLAFNTGEAQSKIVGIGEGNATEANRPLHAHGRCVSIRHRMSMHTISMCPESVGSIEYVDKPVMKLKGTLL